MPYVETADKPVNTDDPFYSVVTIASLRLKYSSCTHAPMTAMPIR